MLSLPDEQAMPAMMTLSPYHQTELFALCVVMHETLDRPGRHRVLSIPDALVLEGVAAGVATSRLVTRLNLGRQGFEYHIGRIARKFVVTNRPGWSPRPTRSVCWPRLLSHSSGRVGAHGLASQVAGAWLPGSWSAVIGCPHHSTSPWRSPDGLAEPLAIQAPEPTNRPLPTNAGAGHQAVVSGASCPSSDWRISRGFFSSCFGILSIGRQHRPCGRI